MKIRQLFFKTAMKIHFFHVLLILLLNCLYIFPQDAFALTKPTLTSPTNNAEVTTPSQTFSWDHQYNDQYEVKIKTSGGTLKYASGKTSSKSITVDLSSIPLTYGSTYKWYVVIYANGQEDSSEDSWFTYKHTGRVDVNGGVSISPSNVTVGQNFDVSFSLSEFQGGDKVLEYVELWIQDSAGNDLYPAKHWDSLSFSANQQQTFSATTFLDPALRGAGSYKAIIRGKVAGEEPFNFGVVSGSGAVNPQSFTATLAAVAGRVDVSGGVSISPSNVTVGQNFDVSFSLSEFQGGDKVLEYVELWIQDSVGNDLYQAKHWDSLSFSANQQQTFSATTFLDLALRGAGSYKAIIRGKVAGEDPFNFGVVSGSGGSNPQSFTATLPAVVGRVDVSGGVSISPSNVTVGQNFDVSFSLSEFQGGDKVLEYVELWIQDSAGNDLYQAKHWDSLSFSANQQQTFSATTFLDPALRGAGSYKAIIRGKVAGDAPFNFGMVSGSGAVNPQSFTAVLPVGRVDVSSGLTVPAKVTVGKNFDVSFNLKEFQGGNKAFEYVELWIQDSSGGDLYMAKRWDNIPFSANQQQTFSTTTFLDPVKDRDAGRYRAIVRGKVAGDVPFNFGVVSGSGAVNPQSFTAVLPGVPLIVKTPVQRSEPTSMQHTPPPSPGKKKGLVFITHGWNSDAYGWVTDMANNIKAQTKNDRKVKWTVLPYDWHKDASCSSNDIFELLLEYSFFNRADLFGAVECGKEFLPMTAHANARNIGNYVGEDIAGENFDYIHFIAHSAGSKLIDSAAEKIITLAREQGITAPKIHSTFLDAYDTIGNASTYGQNSNWAEHYVDVSSSQPLMIAFMAQLVPSISVGKITDLVNDQDIFLPQAFNFDVTTLGEFKYCFVIENPLCFIERHSSPYVWYNKTITDVSADVGFNLALESGRTRLPSFDNHNYRRGAVCSLPSIFNCELEIRIPKPIIDFNCHDIWQCPDNPLLKTYRSDTKTVDLSVPGTITLKSVYPTSVMSRNARSTTSATGTSDSSAWVSMQINVTQPINTLMFDYS